MFSNTSILFLLFNTSRLHLSAVDSNKHSFGPKPHPSNIACGQWIAKLKLPILRNSQFAKYNAHQIFPLYGIQQHSLPWHCLAISSMSYTLSSCARTLQLCTCVLRIASCLADSCSFGSSQLTSNTARSDKHHLISNNHGYTRLRTSKQTLRLTQRD